MNTPFNFTADKALPPAIADKMQKIADNRAANGLISDDGKTHRTQAALEAYQAGHGTHSETYKRAAFGAS
jgi:hypothetical protein